MGELLDPILPEAIDLDIMTEIIMMTEEVIGFHLPDLFLQRDLIILGEDIMTHKRHQ
jgi:hypothetical protein